MVSARFRVCICVIGTCFDAAVLARLAIWNSARVEPRIFRGKFWHERREIIGKLIFLFSEELILVAGKCVSSLDSEYADT